MDKKKVLKKWRFFILSWKPIHQSTEVNFGGAVVVTVFNLYRHEANFSKKKLILAITIREDESGTDDLHLSRRPGGFTQPDLGADSHTALYLFYNQK